MVGYKTSLHYEFDKSHTMFQIPFKGRVSTKNFEESVDESLPIHLPSQVYHLFCRVGWPTFLFF